MKKIIVSLVAIIAISGCSGLYDKSKTLYLGGKKVIIKNWDKIPKSMQDRLIRVDKGLAKYDTVREDVKKIVAGNSEKEN